MLSQMDYIRMYKDVCVCVRSQRLPSLLGRKHTLMQLYKRSLKDKKVLLDRRI